MIKRTGGALLLSLHLEHDSPRPLGTQLYLALREMILEGSLRADERLPATRTIATELGVSRTTVVDAYDRLTAEGLTYARTGAGTYVTAELADGVAGASPLSADAGDEAQRTPRLSKRIDHARDLFFERLTHEPRAFTTALPAFDAFPMGLWLRHVARQWRAHRDVVMGYGDTHGYMPLRRAIAAHLRTNRAISCEPQEIFIVNGAQEAFQLLASMLVDPGDRIWFENPGAIGARNCFAASGAELVPVPVDTEGMVVEHGLQRAPEFRMAVVTPSHQQPLGSTLSLRRRLALLAAATAADAWIVEDDYDGEFRYQGHPPPTLKSIDTTGRVIYVGTFSKTLFPALRLGYVLAPPALVDTFASLMRAFVPGVPSNPQAVVADFIDEGHFSAHLRRMRRLYADRHEALLQASAGQLSGRLEVMPTHTGLHTVAELPSELPEQDVAEAARRREINVVPFSKYCIEPIARNGLVLGFSGISSAAIHSGIAVLDQALGDVQG